MTTDPIAAARAMIEPLTGYTPEPWVGVNMVHADHGGPMTPEEIAEYVCNCVKLGDPNRFLFVSGNHDDGSDADICHTGNGPRGPANTRLIAAAPVLRTTVATLADALEAERAKVAAAYEAAAMDCALQADQVANAAITGLPEQARLRESMEAAYAKATWRIRALTPADAQAALDKLLAEARLEGWRAGREAAADEAQSCTHDPYVVRAIRALPEPKEASHD